MNSIPDYKEQDTATAPKNFALFFPQFHTIAANNKAWGSGFTDWALVANANALNLWRRRAPSAGFYDLSGTNVVRQRIDEAARSGLNGFGLYHYWFDDGPELAVVENWLRTNTLPPRFEVFLIWANESWSKRWAGKNTEIIKTCVQRPTAEQVRRHVEYLIPMLSRSFYTKWRGRPVFVFYRPEFFSNPTETITLYRKEFGRASIDVALGYFIKNENDLPFARLFDFCYLFEPRLFFNTRGFAKSASLRSVHRLLLRLLPYDKVECLSRWVSENFGKNSCRYSFDDFNNYIVSEQRVDFAKRVSCPVQNVISCGWNNVPRYRGNFTELTTPSPKQFEQMLSAVQKQSTFSQKLPLLCNAWNEWSEGAALEPCVYLGDELLKCFATTKLKP